MNLEAEDMKKKKKELVRTIHIKVDEENEFELVIGSKSEAALISASIGELEVKSKKPKSVEGDSKRKSGENTKSPKKKKM